MGEIVAQMKLSRGSTPNIRGMLSPAKFDSMFDIEAFLCPATMSYQGLPGATRSPPEPPVATRTHQEPPGTTEATSGHQEPLAPPGAPPRAPPGITWSCPRSHQDLPKSHLEPPRLFHDKAPPGSISTTCGPQDKTAVKLHVLPSPKLKLQ